MDLILANFGVRELNLELTVSLFNSLRGVDRGWPEWGSNNDMIICHPSKIRLNKIYAPLQWRTQDRTGGLKRRLGIELHKKMTE